MITVASEAEKMDVKEKPAGVLSAKEEREQLAPDIPADLVFLDDVTLLSGVIPKLKSAGFLLVHSREPVPGKNQRHGGSFEKDLDRQNGYLAQKG